MEFAQTKLNKDCLNKPASMKFILQLLEAGHNKSLKDQMVNWVGDRQDKFDLLFEVMFTREYRLVQRAAWPVSYIVQKHPELIRKHFPIVCHALNEKFLPDAVKRNLLRLLQKITIPKRYCGKIADACFKFLTDPKEKAAIKAFAISTVENISGSFPELRQELIIMLENSYDHESPAFRSRAKKIMKQ